MRLPVISNIGVVKTFVRMDVQDITEVRTRETSSGQRARGIDRIGYNRIDRQFQVIFLSPIRTRNSTSTYNPRGN